MLLSSELLVKPETSRFYCRLALILYLLSIVLIVNTSIYWVFKLVLIVLIVTQYKSDLRYQKPHSTLLAIRYSLKSWNLLMKNGQEHVYDEAKILIFNELFQLINFSSANKNKLIILFNDQLSKQQLRLLHLKTFKM